MRYEGNIYRPPGEWRSYLLQATVGCSHNKCTFCGMYKDKRFHIRPMKDILEDIEMARIYYKGQMDKVFICDGDAIIMRQTQLLEILNALYAAFPNLRHVTVYAGPKSTMTKTPKQLRELREAGLTRAYLGVETGWDDLLKQINKGATADELLKAGTMLREAGIDLWDTIILGLAGPGEPSRKHIEETIALINKMKPQHLSALTLIPEPSTPLYQDVKAGRFRLINPEETLVETRMLIEGLTVNPLHFTSNHASNYLALNGTLPNDRRKFLSMIDDALEGKGHLRSEFSRGL